MKQLKVILLGIIYSVSMDVFATGYVSIQGDKFKLDGNDFYPMVVNYKLSLLKNNSTGNYYLSPDLKYSENYYFDSQTGPAKLYRDIPKIKAMGFNTVRICGITPGYVGGVLTIPTGSYSTYYQLLEQLLDLLEANGLKAILLIQASTEYPYLYRDFIEQVSTHFKNNTTIMAYDVINEPLAVSKINIYDKYLMANWVTDWYYSIKNNAPNQLVTIGPMNLESVFNADAGVFMVDFIAYHLYKGTKDITSYQNGLAVDFKWMSEVVNKPWIIGETGYSGTNITSVDDVKVGTELQQRDYADFVLQRALDCDCMGNGWWQFSETNAGGPFESYLGLITYYPYEVEKLAASSFRNFKYYKNSSNCIRISNYYNLMNYSYAQVSGYIKDEKGNPVSNAMIKGYKTTKSFKTFSMSDGYFVLYTDNPNSLFDSIFVSGYGYSVNKVVKPSSTAKFSATYYITKIDRNQWQKKYTNNNSGKIDNWTISSSDKYYNGDFDSDGADELLCVNTSSGGLISMYDFNTGIFKFTWGNGGSTSIGSYLYNFRNNLTVGDFDGDGADELLGVSSTELRIFKFQNNNWVGLWTGTNSSSLWPYRYSFLSGDFNGDGKDEILGNGDNNHAGWITTFRYYNNTWNWSWSNYGNDHAILPYRDNLIVGDYNGDGRDEILGNDIDENGYITIFRYSSNDWNLIWSNNGTDNGMLPYRKKFIVGSIDNDQKKDEILGFTSWATKFDYTDNGFIWTWSTYDDCKIVDYQVNPSDYLFIIKLYKNVPGYLFTKHGNSINMYGRTNLIVNESSLKSGIISIDTTMNMVNTAIRNDNSDEIVLYPNPASDKLFIKNIHSSNATIVIYDLQGKQIVSQQIDANPIDISRLGKGIYVVKLIGSEDVLITRFVKD